MVVADKTKLSTTVCTAIILQFSHDALPSARRRIPLRRLASAPSALHSAVVGEGASKSGSPTYSEIGEQRLNADTSDPSRFHANCSKWSRLSCGRAGSHAGTPAVVVSVSLGFCGCDCKNRQSGNEHSYFLHDTISSNAAEVQRGAPPLSRSDPVPGSCSITPKICSLRPSQADDLSKL